MKKRHPDTNNITKSIFDGIEKSGLIVNDAQIRRLIIEEFYDKEFPRFELELFAESIFKMEYNIIKKENIDKPINYSPPPNKKVKFNNKKDKSVLVTKDKMVCEICGKSINKNDIVTANKQTIIICKKCLTKLF